MLESRDMELAQRHEQATSVLEDIAIVIPTLGRPILEECLEQISSGNSWPGQLIVVDQGSGSQVASWIERLRERGIAADHVISRERGRAAGINRGLERVRTRFVAITDDDCFVERDWLLEMATHLRETPDQIVTGRVEPAGDDLEFCVVRSLTPRVYLRPQLKVHPLIGGNMGVAMAVVERIGLFDEHPSVASAEDSDWGYRALRSGIPIVYSPDVVVRHYSWRNPGQRYQRYRQYARSQGAFYGKHMLSGDWLIPLQTARDLARGPLRWLRGALKADQDMADRGRADTLDLVPGIVSGLRRRRAVEYESFRRVGN